MTTETKKHSIVPIIAILYQRTSQWKQQLKCIFTIAELLLLLFKTVG